MEYIEERIEREIREGNRVSCAGCGWSNMLDDDGDDAYSVKWFSFNDPDVYYCPACSEICECEGCGETALKKITRYRDLVQPKGWRMIRMCICPPIFVCGDCIKKERRDMARWERREKREKKKNEKKIEVDNVE